MKYLNILTKTLLNLSYCGFFIGTISGIVIKRNITIDYKGKYNRKLILPSEFFPILSGILGCIIFPSLLVISPFIIISSFCDSCLFDKFIDNINLKYLITYQRYHQYGPTYNKYYAPSYLNFIITDNKYI